MESAKSFAMPTLVIEERMVIRQGLVSLLQNTRYQVVAAVAEVDQVSLPLDAEPVSLVLLGVSSQHRAVCRMRHVRRAFPHARICVVSEVSDPCTLQEIVRHGADACISNIRSRDVLLKALDLTMLRQHLVIAHHPEAADRTTQDGSLKWPEFLPLKLLPISDPIAERFDLSRMSERELEILGHLATGASNKEIAKSCGISDATVKVHLKTILKKIRVHNRTQAAIVAIQAGLAFPVAPQLTSELS